MRNEGEIYKSYNDDDDDVPINLIIVYMLLFSYLQWLSLS